LKSRARACATAETTCGPALLLLLLLLLLHHHLLLLLHQLVQGGCGCVCASLHLLAAELPASIKNWQWVHGQASNMQQVCERFGECNTQLKMLQTHQKQAIGT
jgi:hypothetical protein